MSEPRSVAICEARITGYIVLTYGPGMMYNQRVIHTYHLTYETCTMDFTRSRTLQVGWARIECCFPSEDLSGGGLCHTCSSWGDEAPYISLEYVSIITPTVGTSLPDNMEGEKAPTAPNRLSRKTAIEGPAYCNDLLPMGTLAAMAILM